MYVICNAGRPVAQQLAHRFDPALPSLIHRPYEGDYGYTICPVQLAFTNTAQTCKYIRQSTDRIFLSTVVGLAQGPRHTPPPTTAAWRLGQGVDTHTHALTRSHSLPTPPFRFHGLACWLALLFSSSTILLACSVLCHGQ